ncbi:hypothetical protein CN221_27355 [Sinorhizobium meliloti]|uniref:hypothetical protein n=1 Tax=Rhizobium meliloti TaxID=382 RepID=UPI000FE04F89|nr:hypothetical protein [Sinorhizobium meliloti]RVG88455.1 hypothetical protein CN221_27355 [Sinorhizobium meliloti]RVH60018.1 hypothetical protein CN209_25535 [Sinorhizobium meliloti]
MGGQYITMWNSDELDKLIGKELFAEGFNVREHALPVILKDTPGNGLFGFQSTETQNISLARALNFPRL